MVASAEKGCEERTTRDRSSPNQSSETLKCGLLMGHILGGVSSLARFQPSSYMLSLAKKGWVGTAHPTAPPLWCRACSYVPAPMLWPGGLGKASRSLGATSITAAAGDSYLVQLHLIRCPPPSSRAAGALVRWHNHDVVPPGKEGKRQHWTLSHLSGRSPNNTCHTSLKDNLLLSLPSKQEKGSVRKRLVFQLRQRKEYSR